ncbi:hypothetical protein D9M69_509940 [compost metagenome]
MAEINDTLTELANAATAVIEESASNQQPIWERRAFMRYHGQGWEIPVDLPEGPYTEADRARFINEFESAYTRFFGRPIDGLPVEIVSWTVKASTPLPPVEEVPALTGETIVDGYPTRPLFDSALTKFVDAQIVERDNLVAGNRVVGPAIVVERETSTIVTSSFDVIVQNDGSLLVQSKSLQN